MYIIIIIKWLKVRKKLGYLFTFSCGVLVFKYVFGSCFRMPAVIIVSEFKKEKLLTLKHILTFFLHGVQIKHFEKTNNFCAYWVILVFP